MRNMIIFLIIYALVIITICTFINATFIHPTTMTTVLLETPKPFQPPQPTPKLIHIGSTVEEMKEILGEPEDIDSWYPGKCYDYDGCSVYTDKDGKVNRWYVNEKMCAKFKPYN